MEEKNFKQIHQKKKKLDTLVESFSTDSEIDIAMADFWSSYKFELGKEILDEINKISVEATNVDDRYAEDKMRQLGNLTKLQEIVISDVSATMSSITIIALKESWVKQYRAYKGIARLLRLLIKSCVISR